MDLIYIKIWIVLFSEFVCVVFSVGLPVVYVSRTVELVFINLVSLHGDRWWSYRHYFSHSHGSQITLHNIDTNTFKFDHVDQIFLQSYTSMGH